MAGEFWQLPLQRTTAILGSKAAAWAADNTPDRFVEYLASSGTQYLDTGVVGRYNMKAEMKMSWQDLSKDVAFLDARASANTNTRIFFCHSYTGSVNFAYGTFRYCPLGNNGGSPDNDKFEKNTIYTVSTEFAKTGDSTVNFTMTVDGGAYTNKVVASGTDSSLVDANCNLYLFANNINGTANNNSKARCYELKIWQDGILVRDFRPCVKDGKGMLWDAVTESLFRPVPDIAATASAVGATTGFPVGVKPVSYVEYVQTDGNQYVDTEVVGKSGTAAEFEMEWLNNAAEVDQAFLGATNGSRYYLWHRAHGKIGYGYGSAFCYPNANNPAAPFTRYDSSNPMMDVKEGYYHVLSSLAAGSQTIEADGTTILSATNSDSINTGLNLYLFAINEKGSPKYYGNARLKWLKIWQDGDLKRDFRPVLMKGYDSAVLWDKVDGRVFLPSAPFSAQGPVTRGFADGMTIIFR